MSQAKPPFKAPPPPPPPRKLRRRIFHVVERNVPVADAVFTHQIHSRDGRGRAIDANQCHSITDHRIRLKFNMKIDNSVLLLCYLDKICLTLTGHFWRALASLYSEARL